MPKFNEGFHRVGTKRVGPELDTRAGTEGPRGQGTPGTREQERKTEGTREQGSEGARGRGNWGSRDTPHPACSPEGPAEMRPCPRTETGLAVPDFRTDSIAETGTQTTRATGARQSPARKDFIAKYLYFNDMHYRCACRLPSCLFAANFAQKSVPKIGKSCTI